MLPEIKTYPLILESVKTAIQEEYYYYEFLDLIRSAVMEAIEQGQIFEDYIDFRYEVEDEFTPNYSPSEWETILEKAYLNRGLSYKKLLDNWIKRQAKLSKTIQEALDNKELVVNVTMDEIVKRAFESEEEEMYSEMAKDIKNDSGS